MLIDIYYKYSEKIFTTSVTAKCTAFDIRGKKVDNLNE